MHRRNGPSLGLGAALCLILFGTGAAQESPIWPWIFLGAVAIGAIGLWRANRSPTAAPEPEPALPTDSPYEVVHVENIALPSAVADYDFRFSASIWWRPFGERQGETPAWSAQAVAAILSRAESITRGEHPGHWDSARYRLQGALGAPAPDDSFAVTAMASHVTLALVAGDRERLENLATLRKTQATWHHERQYERDKREYFATEILSTPGSAVTWWLAQHDDEVERAVDLIGPLACLSAASNNAEVPELFRHLVPPPAARWESPGRSDDPTASSRIPEDGMTVDPLLRDTSQLLETLDLAEGSDERSVFVHRLIRSTAAADRPTAAEHLREHLTPYSPAPDPEPPAATIPTDPRSSWPEPEPPESHRPGHEGTPGGDES
ncbi:hypothetical protein [Streptomyces clavuligerus]|uniref:Uncharacterized protein n=1 Tax=Streptomyces clavuligerus TaxID=1901 RepID=E2Q9T6_STRCL|nr:hypothetical protein [Streptomyces clavuligerus]ANW19531.1 hypothetical protein BB341_15555 [Streptomyces clavuligerus]AXU14138.1 hypothetical protein D1794_16215 [Streptomyces clavuligerus]EFG07663.1 Hypothetical protein SCLAV_2591 [Streptomyces clavuligerus]MBY6304130.1 hypothetical protein [Streptomyces clavuligerus]QCS06911.1 hypothetical protein CRV15_15570 [Streptomyces clavuligerus]